MAVVPAEATTMAKGLATPVVQNAAHVQPTATAATVQTEYPSPITETVATWDGHSSVEEAFASIVERRCPNSSWNAGIAAFAPAVFACSTSCERLPHDYNRRRNPVRIRALVCAFRRFWGHFP
jgi:hypothetical protein